MVIYCSCFYEIAAQHDITVEQVESNHSIILGASLENNELITIKYPLVYRIKNVGDETIFLSFIDYLYQSAYIRKSAQGWDSGVGIFTDNNLSIYESLRDRDIRRYLAKNVCREYVFSTTHGLSGDSVAQDLFKPYMKKMNELGKDTLHIESIQHLKKTNPDLVYKLLHEDSISIAYFKDRFYFTRLPVEVK